jgi:hypothetical protein
VDQTLTASRERGHPEGRPTSFVHEKRDEKYILSRFMVLSGN